MPAFALPPTCCLLLSRTSHPYPPQYKWALWQVDDSGQSVVIAAVGDKQSGWADFLAALPDADCRYGGGWVGAWLGRMLWACDRLWLGSMSGQQTALDKGLNLTGGTEVEASGCPAPARSCIALKLCCLSPLRTLPRSV